MDLSEPKTVELVFSMEELSVLDKALQNMPYYLAAPLIASINKQLENKDGK